jgi:hypothetical protein
LVIATKAAKATGASMLLMNTRMTAPAAHSPISSGGERRATSAICTPFQPDTEKPATAARAMKAHPGQPGSANPNAMVDSAEPTDAMASVVVLEAA